nr:hypothetical protein [Tanacetum cinerariifolium]
MVTYNSDNDIVEVCDDLEVNEFMEFVVKSSRIVTFCIVESSVNGTQLSNSGSNQQSNFIHATPSVNVYQIEFHATQICQTQISVFPGSGGFYQNLPSYQQMHGFSENPMYVPGFPGYPMQDPQSDSANRKLKHVVGSPKNKKPNKGDLLDDEKLRPFEEKIMGSVLGKVKRLSDEDESSESDEDAKTTPAMNKNFKEDKFWNMPPLLKTPVLDIKKKEVMSESSRIYRGKEIMTDMNARFKIDISYSQAWRAKCYALQLLRGTPEESFAELPLYCHNLKLKNQGTITHIETDDEDRFEIFFCRRCCDTYICVTNVTIYYNRWCTSSSSGTLNIDKQQRASYNEVIFDVGHPSEWDQPDGLITVLPPEYVRKITEEASEDDHFTRGPWLSAVQYLAVEGSITTGCFGDMKTFIKNGK